MRLKFKECANKDLPLAQMFSCEFYEISKNTFSTEHLRTTASIHLPLLNLVKK